jgi:hypothetical protein
MSFLEEKGIIHGNLKAENVFVCKFRMLKIVHSKLIELMKTSENYEHVEGMN